MLLRPPRAVGLALLEFRGPLKQPPSTLSQRLQVGDQSQDIVTLVRPKYILDNYMDPLGIDLLTLGTLEASSGSRQQS